MVKIEDKLYGPFNYDNKGENLIVSAFDPYNFYIGEYALEAFKPKVICLSDERNQFHTMYLIGYEKSSIFDQCLQKHDWVSDDKLIGEIISILKSNNATKFTRENRRVIKESIEQAAKTQKIGLLTDESRTNKLSSLLEYMETREELKESLVYEVLNKEEYIDKVIKFIVENRFELVSKKLHETDKVNKEIESQNQNLNEIKKQIELFKLEKKTTEEDIDRIKKEIAKGEIDNLKQIKMERKEEEKKKEDLILYNNLASDYITLEQQKVKLEEKNEIARQNYRHWDQEQRKLERELTDRIHNFTSSAALDIINKDFLGRVMKIVDGELTCKNCLHNILNEEKLLLEFSAHELIDHMTYYICEKSGRDYSRNDIVNLLICISQGFITTFAGEPGTGKTSLCNILSKALGLAGRLGDRRFVEVSVERGWSSYKDYIGYYNPLTKSFEKSNEEVFRAIETLDHEGENSRAPFFILLDEANLSPIEHYWANFIRLCDMDMDVNRTLNMGGEQTWKIPKTLRFLATVNFDHTTEELSPRFLDRAWVVMLEQCKIAEDLLMDYPVENHDQIFSFEKILEYLHQERMNN